MLNFMVEFSFKALKYIKKISDTFHHIIDLKGQDCFNQLPVGSITNFLVAITYPIRPFVQVDDYHQNKIRQSIRTSNEQHSPNHQKHIKTYFSFFFFRGKCMIVSSPTSQPTNQCWTLVQGPQPLACIFIQLY